MADNRKTWAKATWQKELQRVISFSALEVIYGEASMNETAKASRMFEIFHGNINNGTASFIDLALSGNAQFAHLWDSEELAINQEGNAERIDGVQLSLKSGITQKPELKLIAGQAFTRNSLSRATILQEQAIGGRNLLGHANNTLKHVKKAVAFAEEFMPNGELPSGKTEEDLDRHVRLCMFKMLNGKTSLAEGDPPIAIVETILPEVSEATQAASRNSPSPVEATVSAMMLLRETSNAISVTSPLIATVLDSQLGEAVLDSAAASTTTAEPPALPGDTLAGDTSPSANKGDETSPSLWDDEAIPDGWIFVGWSAFKCFGPMAPKPYRSALLFTEDEDRVPGKGKDKKKMAGLPSARSSVSLKSPKRKETTH